MNDLITQAATALQSFGSPEALEQYSLDKPQVDCAVVHHFGPGLCIREVRIPAGTFAVGHRQKYEHMNILLQGKVLVLGENKTVQSLEAPLLFVGKPGRKIGFILEDMVWQNIYATKLTDPAEVEALFIDKSDNWQNNARDRRAAEILSRTADREDYRVMLDEMGVTEQQARAQSENITDQTRVSCPIVKVADSCIEGKGLFVTAPLRAGDTICAARIDGKRTQAGRYTNHSAKPNAKMVRLPNGDIDLVALVNLVGCRGGDDGEEVTVDYRQARAVA